MKDIQKIKEFFSKPVNEKKETAIDMAKKQLDALGVKYEMSKTDKVRPFKVIYRPTNKPDRWYDEFEDIIHLFNLGSAVKQSMNEASKEEETEFHKKLDKLVHNTFGKRKNELEEALVKKVISKIREAKSTPCWKGYEQKGMKEKNGKQVPNCVPKK
jgi:hypothetical protein